MQIENYSYKVKVSLALFFTVLIAFTLFLLFADDYYLMKSDFAIGADTLTYLDTAEQLNIDITDASLIGVSFNFFGPVYLFQLFNFNFFNLYVINCILYISSYLLLIRTFDVNIKFFNLFIWLNPMILFSLIVVNKEILAFGSMSLFFVFTKNRKVFLLIISIILAFLTRWQMVAFILICLILVSKINPFRNRRILSLMFLIFSASIFYGVNSDVLYEGFERTSETIDFQADRWFGIVPIMNDLQARGMYFLVVFPKVLFNLFGNPFAVLKIPSLIYPENYKFFYNDFVISLHQLAITILIFLAYFKKVLNINRDGIYFAVVYLIIFSLSPIVNTRYIFPIYVLLLVEVASSYKTKVING